MNLCCFNLGSVRPGLTFRPIILCHFSTIAPLPGLNPARGRYAQGWTGCPPGPRRSRPTRRLPRRLPVGRRRPDPHLERHPALTDERPEERVDGGRHGQAQLVKDDGGLPLDLRVEADRRDRYVRRHGLTPPRVSRCDHSTAFMRRARPSSPFRAAGR